MIQETSETEETGLDSPMTTFGFRNRTRIGTWNIRSLSEPSRLSQVCREMRKSAIKILGLTEVRWRDSGRLTTREGDLFLYSGSSTESQKGVGIIVSSDFKRSLISWQPINERLMTARFQSKLRKITFVVCYAPTEAADFELKDEFYGQLEAALSACPQSDIKIVVGDFNSKVGNINTNLEHVMGKYGLPGATTDNGNRLIDLCSSQQLFIGGTKFLHKDIHKYTWQSPDGYTRNQIDHILISRKFLSSLLDVRTKRSMDVGSDHQVVVGTIRLKLSANRNTRKTVRRVNISRLKDPQVAEAFDQRLDQELESQQVPTWEHIERSLRKAAEETIGFTDRDNKPWIRDTTWQTIDERKEVKIRLDALRPHHDEWAAVREQYNNLERKVKRMAREDKRKFHNDIACEAEQAANCGDTRGVYMAIKKLTGKGIRSCPPLKSAEGRTLTTEEEQLNRWSEHFSSTAPRAEETSPLQMQTRRNARRDISTEPPDLLELEAAIKKLKNGKSPGPDGIAAELFKCNPRRMATLLRPIIREVWVNKRIPERWKDGVIITIPKKGDLSQCINWRGITLLNTIEKLLAIVISNRLAPVLDELLRPNQAGFRKGRSCTDQINTLRIIIEQSVEWRTSLYILFVDFERAFDSLDRNAIWSALANLGVPDHIIQLIQELYSGASCRVRHLGAEGEAFSINTGVRQGCVLSSLLFLVSLDNVIARTNMEVPTGIQFTINTRLDDLDYADDLALLSNSFDGIAQKLRRLDYNGKKIGLKINVGKTKLMRIGSNNTQPLSLDGLVIEDVDEFCYLGALVTKTGGTEADIQNRINRARKAYYALNKVWRSNTISNSLKLRIFDSCVVSILLYGCETWGKHQNLRRLETFVNKCLRRILKIFWPNIISNVDLLRRANNRLPLAKEVVRRKWRWIGHTLRKPAGDIAKTALDWNPQGSRRAGRPSNTWRRTIEQEIARSGKTWRQIKALATDRDAWRIWTDAQCAL